MPGSSLWLVPPEDSELYKTIHHLILQEVPAVFPDASPPRFTPHVTLTSDTVSDQQDPQEWLDSITLPHSVKHLRISIEQLHAGKIFFQSLIMLCEKSTALCELAEHCRAAGVKDSDLETAENWARREYVPHCSLMYSDVPRDRILANIDDVNAVIKQAKLQRRESRTVSGAEIWLVPTSKSIDRWKPIARRRLEGVSWEWRT